MLITEPLPLIGANLIFCERIRDQINSDPRRRAEVVLKGYKIHVRDHSIPIREKNLHKGKRILGWVLDGGSGEA